MAEYQNLKVVKFDPPEGDYRKLVKDAILEMFNIEWTPNEDFHLGWKGNERFEVNLDFKKGETYTGVAYSDTKCSLREFMHYVKDGVFTPNEPYYETMVGNNCQTIIIDAVNRLIDLPFSGGMRPTSRRGTMLELVAPLKRPAAWGDNYDTVDVWHANCQNDIFEAFANSTTGDILFKNIKNKSGHIRFVSLPAHVERLENGLVDPEKSYLTTIEQTNQFDQTRTDNVKTTWWIDHKYTFKNLFDKCFMPITLTIYSSGEVSKPAYMFFDGENDAQSLKKGLQGKVSSTFPLCYVRATVENKNGDVVRRAVRYNFSKTYEVDTSELYSELGLDTLEKGKYLFRLNTAIARGDCDFEKFEFEV